jgi:hypothetical protein
MPVLAPISLRNAAFFKRELAINPQLGQPRPLEGVSLEQRSREWRGAMRSYDAARIELGLKTPNEIQQQNSPFHGFRPRIVGLGDFIPHAKSNPSARLS